MPTSTNRSLAADEQPYPSADVDRKGETGELVVFANRVTRTETDEKGEETEREIPFLKGYTVFNAEM